MGGKKYQLCCLPLSRPDISQYTTPSFYLRLLRDWLWNPFFRVRWECHRQIQPTPCRSVCDCRPEIQHGRYIRRAPGFLPDTARSWFFQLGWPAPCRFRRGSRFWSYFESFHSLLDNMYWTWLGLYYRQQFFPTSDQAKYLAASYSKYYHLPASYL